MYNKYVVIDAEFIFETDTAIHVKTDEGNKWFNKKLVKFNKDENTMKMLQWVYISRFSGIKQKTNK